MKQETRRYTEVNIDTDQMLVRAKIKYRRPHSEEERRKIRIMYSIE